MELGGPVVEWHHPSPHSNPSPARSRNRKVRSQTATKRCWIMWIPGHADKAVSAALKYPNRTTWLFKCGYDRNQRRSKSGLSRLWAVAWPVSPLRSHQVATVATTPAYFLLGEGWRNGRQIPLYRCENGNCDWPGSEQGTRHSRSIILISSWWREKSGGREQYRCTRSLQALSRQFAPP